MEYICLTLIVNKKGGADTLSLVAEVDTILARFKKQYEGKFKIEICSLIFFNLKKNYKKLLIIYTNSNTYILSIVIVQVIVRLVMEQKHYIGPRLNHEI